MALSYLEHFHLNTPVFGLTPDTRFFCRIVTQKEALNILLLSLDAGDAFVKIIGEVGVGKTLLCRRFLDILDDSFISCYIHNPKTSPSGLLRALATELSIPFPIDISDHILTKEITNQLISHYKSGKKAILIIDEAQALDDDCLETVRLLTNLETKTDKLLQVILLGQPELDTRLSQRHLRQLQQRISFSYQLKPLTHHEVKHYLASRLITAGHPDGLIFSQKATKLIHHASSGIPRILNILGHKALLSAYGANKQYIDADEIKDAIHDSRDVLATVLINHKHDAWLNIGITLSIIIASSTLASTAWLLYQHWGHI